MLPYYHRPSFKYYEGFHGICKDKSGFKSLAKPCLPNADIGLPCLL